MISFPGCKINLGLHILFKRDDDYHEVETVMYPIPLKDILEIVISKEFKFTSTGLPIPGKTANNICLLAYQLLQSDFNLAPVHIHLHKIIPMGGGLGGGSSNCAFTLILLNNLFELKLSAEKLKYYAAQLGSDCAFFVDNNPQLCTGRGEVTESIGVDLTHYYIKIVNLGIHISTAEAYRGVVPSAPVHSLHDVINKDISTWKDHLKNDFESGIFLNHPELAKAKEKMYKEGAVYASMTGSGSTLFGLYQAMPSPTFGEEVTEEIIRLS